MACIITLDIARNHPLMSTERDVALYPGDAPRKIREGGIVKIFKIDAQGDTVFVKADSEKNAIARLTEFMGEIPRSLLTIEVVDALPTGEEFL